MTPEIGLVFLIVALCMSVIQVSALPFRVLRPLLNGATFMQSLLVTLSFFCLLISYVESDFSVLNVAKNSHTLKPLIYKISASWGNHEGSMLLWILVLSLYGLWLAMTNPPKGRLRDIKQYALSVQGLLQVGFISFVLFTSNPFERLLPIPLDGMGLNPLLQDIGLAIHPPLLYGGYVGFGIVFSIGVAALIVGKVDKEFARFFHPFIMVAWGFLAAGIAVGSWWAYRELGWGGWWFWDAVENASLLPWLAGTALFHSNILLMKRNLLKGWVVLLSIITFSLSMIGTFLVRSGIITSVHSFVNDPERGFFILAFLGIITTAALTVYAVRAPILSRNDNGDCAAADNDKMEVFSRDGTIVINNLFLLVATFSVLLATIYPMIQELSGARPVTVGASYFNKTFFPLMAPLMFVLGVSLLLPWRRSSMRVFLKNAKYPAIASFTALVIIFIATEMHSESKYIWLLIGTTLGVWIISSNILYMRNAIRATKSSLDSSGDGVSMMSVRKGFTRIPYSTKAAFVGHLGLGIFIMAIAFSSTFRVDKELKFKLGDVHNIAGYEVELKRLMRGMGKNYVINRAHFEVRYNQQKVIDLYPELRIYPVRSNTTTESAIDYNLWRDFYIALRKTGDIKAKMNDSRIVASVYYVPAMMWLWVGMLLMIIGSIMTVFGMRK